MTPMNCFHFCMDVLAVVAEIAAASTIIIIRLIVDQQQPVAAVLVTPRVTVYAYTCT